VTGAGSSSVAPTPSATDVPTPSVAETESTVKPPEVTVQVGTGPCEDELGNVLRGAELDVRVDELSTFYVKGDRFVLCDTIGGRTTIHKALPLAPAEVDAETYAVSSSFAPKRVPHNGARSVNGNDIRKPAAISAINGSSQDNNTRSRVRVPRTRPARTSVT